MRKGTGRAAIELAADPQSARLHEALLEACTRNLVYDPQCEEPRAAYLARLIRLSGRVRSYWEALVAIATDATRQTESGDALQIFEVLCALAPDWPDRQWGVLQPILAAAEFDSEGRDCMEPFVRLFGVEGLVVCLETFGNHIGRTEWNEDFAFLRLLDAATERDGAEIAKTGLQDARSRSARFDAALRTLESLRSSTQNWVSRAPVQGRLSRIGQIASQWGKDASPQDLAWATSELLKHLDGSDVQNTLTLLRVFWKRDFPGPIAKLTRAVTGADKNVANAAVRVLCRLKHPEIRELALASIAEGDRACGVRLLESNFMPGDATLIRRALCEAQTDEDDYHSLGFAALDVFANNAEAVAEGEPVFLDVYTHGPCSSCRERAIRCLDSLGAVPSWMAAECQYDCVPSVAARFTSAASP